MLTLIPIATTILKDDLTHNAISKSVKLTYETFKNIISYNRQEVTNNLEEIDIMNQLQIVDALMNDIDKNKNIVNNYTSIEVALKQLHEIVNKVHQELNTINEIIKYNESIWFPRFRAIDYNKNIQELKIHKKIMDGRLNLLIKLMQIIH